jgi:hypothetical protein
MVVATVAVASTGMTIVISPKASPAAASSCQARAPRRRAAINSAVAMSSGTYTVATTGTTPNDHWRSRAKWLHAHISTGDATHTKHDQFDADGNTGSPGALSVAERAKADFAEVAGQLGLLRCRPAPCCGLNSRPRWAVWPSTCPAMPPT